MLQSNLDKNNFKKDMLLLEQDAHLLEEARYLSRLHNSESLQNKNVNHYTQQIVIPSQAIEKTRQERETKEIEARMNLQKEVIEKREKLRRDLSLQNARHLRI